jgi:hypothetical protein
MRSRPLLVLLVVAAAGSAAGCGQSGSGAAPTATPTPVGACPRQPERPEPTGCVPYDPDKAMGQNEAYRQRRELPPADAAAIRPHVARVRAALAPLTGGARRPVERQVRAALLAAGYPAASVQTTPDRSPLGGIAANVGFGVSTEHGCVWGLVDARRLEVSGGGAIADGGCLEMPGH